MASTTRAIDVRKLWSGWALLWIPGIAGAVQEQELTAPQANKQFVILGYIDGSYNTLLNSNQFTSGTFDRVFDLKTN
jgi:hypothetical protein